MSLDFFDFQFILLKINLILILKRIRMEKSCGILAYRWKDGELQVLLGKSAGMFGRKLPWNIPKGHIEEGESEFACAVREFEEETGLEVPQDRYCIMLGDAKTSAGKVVVIFGVEYDYNPEGDDVPITSMTFVKEHPRHSGHFITVPELECAKYMAVEDAVEVMFQYQRVFVERLKSLVGEKVHRLD